MINICKYWILAIVFLLCLSCGVKKGAAVEPTAAENVLVEKEHDKLPISEQPIGAMPADYAKCGKPTISLLWQTDQLQITLNQGRRLKFYRAETDTLYLYETARDMADFTTRRYTINIPSRELLIIKYNDSLVYPIMPSDEICEYPLDIKSMGVKNITKYNETIQECIENQQKSRLWGGMYNAAIEPLERRTGIYFFNAGLYTYGTDCECIIDSSQTLVINWDGTWLQYNNEKLKNCGIMRKFKLPLAYEAISHKGDIVYFSDTISITFLSYNERKERREKNISWKPNEYNYTGKVNASECSLFTVYPCKSDSMMHHLYDGNDVLMFEGTTCGWKKTN